VVPHRRNGQQWNHSRPPPMTQQSQEMVMSPIHTTRGLARPAHTHTALASGLAGGQITLIATAPP
jgi:hypothetical protein